MIEKFLKKITKTKEDIDIHLDKAKQSIQSTLDQANHVLTGIKSNFIFQPRTPLHYFFHRMQRLNKKLNMFFAYLFLKESIHPIEEAFTQILSNIQQNLPINKEMDSIKKRLIQLSNDIQDVEPINQLKDKVNKINWRENKVNRINRIIWHLEKIESNAKENISIKKEVKSINKHLRELSQMNIISTQLKTLEPKIKNCFFSEEDIDAALNMYIDTNMPDEESKLVNEFKDFMKALLDLNRQIKSESDSFEKSMCGIYKNCMKNLFIQHKKAFESFKKALLTLESIQNKKTSQLDLLDETLQQIKTQISDFEKLNILKKEKKTSLRKAKKKFSKDQNEFINQSSNHFWEKIQFPSQYDHLDEFLKKELLQKAKEIYFENLNKFGQKINSKKLRGKYDGASTNVTHELKTLYKKVEETENILKPRREFLTKIYELDAQIFNNEVFLKTIDDENLLDEQLPAKLKNAYHPLEMLKQECNRLPFEQIEINDCQLLFSELKARIENAFKQIETFLFLHFLKKLETEVSTLEEKLETFQKEDFLQDNFENSLSVFKKILKEKEKEIFNLPQAYANHYSSRIKQLKEKIPEILINIKLLLLRSQEAKDLKEVENQHPVIGYDPQGTHTIVFKNFLRHCLLNDDVEKARTNLDQISELPHDEDLQALKQIVQETQEMNRFLKNRQNDLQEELENIHIPDESTKNIRNTKISNHLLTYNVLYDITVPLTKYLGTPQDHLDLFGGIHKINDLQSIWNQLTDHFCELLDEREKRVRKNQPLSNRLERKIESYVNLFEKAEETFQAMENPKNPDDFMRNLNSFSAFINEGIEDLEHHLFQNRSHLKIPSYRFFSHFEFVRTSKIMDAHGTIIHRNGFSSKTQTLLEMLRDTYEEAARPLMEGVFFQV